MDGSSKMRRETENRFLQLHYLAPSMFTRNIKIPLQRIENEMSSGTLPQKLIRGGGGEGEDKTTKYNYTVRVVILLTSDKKGLVTK